MIGRSLGHLLVQTRLGVIDFGDRPLDPGQLLGDGRFTHLTGGVEEYLDRVRSRTLEKPTTASTEAAPKVTAKQQRMDQRAIAKEMTRIERAIAKLDDTEAGLHEQMAEAATDHARLVDLNNELREAERRKAELEDQWMRLASDLEG